jgi:3-oxoacyl-ACP reductase-like protein
MHQHYYQPRVFSFQLLLFGKRARIIRWDRTGALVTPPFEWKDGGILGDFLRRFSYCSVGGSSLIQQGVVKSKPKRKPPFSRCSSACYSLISSREGVRKLEAYVEEMATGGLPPTAVNVEKVQEDVLKLWNVIKSQPEISQEQKNRIKALYDGVLRSLRKGPTTETRWVTPRTRRSSSQFLQPQMVVPTTLPDDKIPLLHLKRKSAGSWECSSNLTSVYLDLISEIATSGTTFKDKNALLIGVRKGSIGVEILKGLLSGGAHVVITTSRCSRKTVEYYQGIFQTHGSRGSALTVVLSTKDRSKTSMP